MASMQPQLDALTKAMAQKGVSAAQMAQLKQAMDTIKSLAGKASYLVLFCFDLRLGF